VKVALGGDGGDELFGGYDRYYGNLYAGYYAMVPPAFRRGVVGPLLGLIPDGDWYKSKGHQMKWLHRASFLAGGERYARTLGYFYFPPETREGLYGPELLRAAAEFDAYGAVREAYERAPADHPVDKMLYADSQVRLPDHSVMILDRTSMAHGLEARSPFMDHKVAEFAASLPTELKVRWRPCATSSSACASVTCPRSCWRARSRASPRPCPTCSRTSTGSSSTASFTARNSPATASWAQGGIDACSGSRRPGRPITATALCLLLNARRLGTDCTSRVQSALRLWRARSPATG
jgi:asparagine synthase (glutamine-hydrolysing)